MVAGANEVGYHLLHVNLGRDYQANIITDIALAQAGDACPTCGQAMHTTRGVEVGNIFKLGTHYSEKMNALFLDVNGQQQPIVMGCYGIGVGRLLACVAEHHHDDQGLIWPVTIAPYQVHLLALRGGEETADSLYTQCQAAGLDVLYDDQKRSPGVKFKDADLIGLPVRLTVSKRSLEQGGVEVKWRHEDERAIISLADIITHIQERLQSLEAALSE